MAITPPDIIISLILAFFTLNGFRHGFIEEMGRLLSLIGGFILASKFHNLLVPFLSPYIDGETLRVTVAYLGVFAVSVIVITMIAKILQKFIELVLLGWLNRLLGLLLGLLKGFLIISLLIFIIQAIFIFFFLIFCKKSFVSFNSLSIFIIIPTNYLTYTRSILNSAQNINL